MPYTSQRPAASKTVLALALKETLFCFAWGALGGTLFLPLTSLWFIAILPSILIAIHFLVSMELSDDANPLVSLEIRQHNTDGSRRVSRHSAYFRILLTVILFPGALTGYITLLLGKPSLPELITGTRLIAIDRRLDPRPISVIDRVRKRAAARIRTLTFVPLAAAAAAFFLFNSAPEAMTLIPQETTGVLPASEQELLADYLELVTLHPEELEYHVRLASLYHRNDMQQDLRAELTVIRSIDSTHAILLLADTTVFSFEILEPLPENTINTEEIVPVHVVTPAATVDSTVADSVTSVLADTIVVQVDSIETAIDSLVIELTTDTIAVVPEILPEILPDTTQTPVVEDTTSVPEEIYQEPEEDTVEPDTLIQP